MRTWEGTEGRRREEEGREGGGRGEGEVERGRKEDMGSKRERKICGNVGRERVEPWEN